MRWMIILIVMGVAGLSGVSYLLAQNMPLEDTLTCDPEELLTAQAETQTQLDAFAQDLAQTPDDTLAALYDIGVLYQRWALDCGYIPDEIGGMFVGDDVDQILRVLETIRPDTLNGQLIYNDVEAGADGRTLGCIVCHANPESIGPSLAGTWTRWDEIHRNDPALADYTFERYIVESIVRPYDYHMPGYPEYIMPDNYGARLSYQNIADIVAYLFGQDQFLP